MDAKNVGSKDPEGAKVARDKSREIEWRVRPMRYDDIERCLEIWSQVELAEAHVTVANALKMDPEGLYVAELEPGGTIVGMCSGVLIREDLAFMGFYAVAPEFQGIGIGRELWAATVARLDSSYHNIGLYGVPGMSEKYEKSGFRLEDSIRMFVFESCPGQQLQLDSLRRLEDLSSGSEMVEIGRNSDKTIFKQLLDYDATIHSQSREDLLIDYLQDAKELPLTLALIDAGTSQTLSDDVRNSLVITEDKLQAAESGSVETNSRQALLLGYGCIRHDNTGGAMIGPLYARSSAACEVILGQLIERFHMRPGGKYSVMPLTSNGRSVELLQQIGLQKMDQCTRMFTRAIPEAAFDQIYYVHSPNFTLF